MKWWLGMLGFCGRGASEFRRTTPNHLNTWNSDMTRWWWWWFEIFVYFLPDLGGMIQVDLYFRNEEWNDIWLYREFRGLYWPVLWGLVNHSKDPVSNQPIFHVKFPFGRFFLRGSNWVLQPPTGIRGTKSLAAKFPFFKMNVWRGLTWLTASNISI